MGYRAYPYHAERYIPKFSSPSELSDGIIDGDYTVVGYEEQSEAPRQISYAEPAELCAE